jgi:hypothetical protein
VLLLDLRVLVHRVAVDQDHRAVVDQVEVLEVVEVADHPVQNVSSCGMVLVGWYLQNVLPIRIANVYHRSFQESGLDKEYYGYVLA